MSDLTHQWTYKPARVLAVVTIAFLSILTALDVITTLGDVIATLIYPTWNDPEAEVSDGELLIAITIFLGGLAMIAVYIACAVLFCIWQYRVAANARALGAEGLEISPGWNAGWWFIPFANLVMPMRAMRENYNALRPDAGAGSTSGTPAIIGWWWATWLISNFISGTSGNSEKVTKDDETS